MVLCRCGMSWYDRQHSSPSTNDETMRCKRQPAYARRGVAIRTWEVCKREEREKREEKEREEKERDLQGAGPLLVRERKREREREREEEREKEEREREIYRELVHFW